MVARTVEQRCRDQCIKAVHEVLLAAIPQCLPTTHNLAVVLIDMLDRARVTVCHRHNNQPLQRKYSTALRWCLPCTRFFGVHESEAAKRVWRAILNSVPQSKARETGRCSQAAGAEGRVQRGVYTQRIGRECAEVDVAHGRRMGAVYIRRVARLEADDGRILRLKDIDASLVHAQRLKVAIHAWCGVVREPAWAGLMHVRSVKRT